MDWWEQIDGQGRFARVEALEKGWSRDRKFIVDLKDGQRWLLRLSPADQWERKKKEYVAMERLPQDCAALLPRPKGFGRCDAGIYTLLSFVPGQDAEPALRGLTPAQQYGLGLRAGLALRQLHALPPLRMQSPGRRASTPRWTPRYAPIGTAPSAFAAASAWWSTSRTIERCCAAGPRAFSTEIITAGI